MEITNTDDDITDNKDVNEPAKGREKKKSTRSSKKCEHVK